MAASSTEWHPRVLVIGPGGIQGLKALGFLSPVEDAGLLKYVDTYCGVSVGAIITLLMVAGYQIREIVGEAASLNIFKDIENLTIQSIVENKGFMSNEPVRRRLIQLIVNKFGTVPTLRGLYLQTGKAFIAVTLNATDEECVMMDPFTYPHVSCVDATMFSMNIPFVFYQLIYNGKTYVDGALANPYPIDYFDDGATNILGIYIKSNLNKTPAVPDQRPRPAILQRISEASLAPGPIPMGIYSYKIVHSLMDQRRNHILRDASDKCRHVCLETGDTIDPLGYEIKVEEKAQMLVEGFNQGKEFISEIRAGTYRGPPIRPKPVYAYPPHYVMDETPPDPEISVMDVINTDP
jgi:predicted acylesterase/phospholipase RssA